MAHFRRPDAIVTHPTYPAMPRTTLHGLIASILGKPRLDGENWTGYSLLRPVRTVTQEMSMLGKGWMGSGGDAFNRPTSIQLIIKPHYRVYYAGDHFDDLKTMIEGRRSHFHTYLGSAFCLTFPILVGVIDAEEVRPLPGATMLVNSVVPADVVERLLPESGERYLPMRGARYSVDSERTFEGNLNLIIEESGRRIRFRVKGGLEGSRYKFFATQDGIQLCLW